MCEIDAVMRPSGRSASIRQHLLSQEARDLAAYLFSLGIPVNPVVPIPATAIEVKIEDAVNHILDGGDGFKQHGGSDSLEYFTHAQDDEWAIVFAWDCDGSARMGMALFEEKERERWQREDPTP